MNPALEIFLILHILELRNLGLELIEPIFDLSFNLLILSINLFSDLEHGFVVFIYKSLSDLPWFLAIVSFLPLIISISLFTISNVSSVSFTVKSAVIKNFRFYLSWRFFGKFWLLLSCVLVPKIWIFKGNLQFWRFYCRSCRFWILKILRIWRIWA